MENILEVRELSRNFTGFKLDRVSFSLPRGYIMGFIGPNGAGKTTTIKLIMNLIRRDSGSVAVFGLDNLTHHKQIHSKIGFVYDENHYYETLTLEEMKRITAYFYNDWDEGLFKKYLRLFGLSPRQKIKDLSRGMKMKYSLALALSHRAELILMDEPTSGLDPVFRSELLEILRSEMQDERKGIIFSTHITSDLERIADYICFINNGKVVFSDNRDDALGKYLLVKGPLDILDESARKLLIGTRENSYGFEALTKNPDQVKKMFRDQAVYESANLDNILLFTVRSEKSDSSY